MGNEFATIDRGLSVDPEQIRFGHFKNRASYTLVSELLALPAPPGAIVTSNDGSAFGVMEAIRGHSTMAGQSGQEFSPGIDSRERVNTDVRMETVYLTMKFPTFRSPGVASATIHEGLLG